MRYLVLLLLFWTNTAMACDSYEECMKVKDDWVWVVGNGKRYKDPVKVYPSDARVLKAIAFKLDEISKKLGEK